jgi:hypothetical protein
LPYKAAAWAAVFSFWSSFIVFISLFSGGSSVFDGLP